CVQKHVLLARIYLKIIYICTINRYFYIRYMQYNTNFSIFCMKKREIKRRQHVEGKGLLKQIENLRLLDNVSKSKLVNNICSVAMYNRYLQGSNISLDALEGLAGYFGYKVTLTLNQ